MIGVKKIELLSPVGNIECLYQAIHNGCDAVYLGGKKFGARNFANNFNEEELVHAIKYCHLYGVKIYVTVNTIIFDDEVDEFLGYIKFLYENNVDAVIMQDLGMIKRVRELYPSLEIHASTQMHNHNAEGVKLLEKLGVKRVVFARELSIQEINNIPTNMEREVFVHGALCVCYSGCCLFSAMTTNRSGNRGECVASCRLPYYLLKNGKKQDIEEKYLLSTKELNTIDNINELIKSNISSLKIEGRMKSPEYVGFITKLYRNAIDAFYNNKEFKLSKDDFNKMKLLFNREFTKGYLFGDYGQKLMNIKSPNHQGLEIGNIIYIDKNKIKINLKEDLNQEDGIRFVIDNKGMIVNRLYNEKGLLTSSVKKGNIAVIDNKIGIKQKQNVSKTIDKLLIQELGNYNAKRIPINIEIKANVNKKLSLTISDLDDNTVSIETCTVEQSINRPTTYDDIKKQILKLGNTPFKENRVDIEVDNNVFIPLKDLNEIRRIATEKLISIRENRKITGKENVFILDKRNVNKEKFNINALVRNEEQLKACISNDIDNIYVTDYTLYKKYKNNNIYYVLPRVISNYREFTGENLLVRELGSIERYNRHNNLISDYTLNVSNNSAIELLNNLGINRICLSPEVNIDSISKTEYNTEIVVYGKLELMITKYCILNMLINKDNKKCNICKNDNYSLMDEKGRIYSIKNENCINIIYDYKNVDLSDSLYKIRKKVNNIRLNFLDENQDQVIEIIKKIRGNIV